MRQLAMRFRGLFRGDSLEKLDEWLRGAFSCGIYSMRRFAKTLPQDKSAVQNAATDPWSNGQTEGQIFISMAPPQFCDSQENLMQKNLTGASAIPSFFSRAKVTT